MARVRFGGITLNADPVKELPSGDWLMTARDHTGRTSPGTTILVKQSEILEMAAAEKPGPLSPTSGLADLEAAMAEELKTLKPASQIIAEVTKATGPPPQRPQGRQQPEQRR